MKISTDYKPDGSCKQDIQGPESSNAVGFFGCWLKIAKNLCRYGSLLGQMIRTDIKGRFAGSMGGFIWHVLQPVVMLFAYLGVFLFIFDLKAMLSSSLGMSAIYILAGLFPWMMISEGVSQASVTVIQSADLIKRSNFPKEVLIAKSVITPICSSGIALLLMAVYISVSQSNWRLIFFLPVLLAIQIVFTFSVSFLISTISVFFRDFLHLTDIIIRFWIFFTPIFYPMTALPQWARTLMYLNPVYPIVSLYQSAFLSDEMIPWSTIFLALFWTIGLLFPSTFIFNKLKDEFADWL